MSKLVLFQGDSITDCERSRQNAIRQGYGYATMVQGQLGYDCPGKYDFINRGISGNRIVDVYARIKADIINLKPDYMSLLIGVNDVWHELGGGNGVAPEKFEKIYGMLIEEIKEALPDIKIMLLEPFVLKGTATYSEEDPTIWQRFDSLVRANAAAAKRVAEKFDLPFIELQAGFDSLCESAPASYWLADGVHPTAMGHCFIKDKWLETFKNL
jgi:lysophospholipase L1-like esterase